MSRKIKTITPLHSFEICPENENVTGSGILQLLGSSKPAYFAVYPSQSKQEAFNDIKSPAYYVCPGPPDLLPFWPFSSQPTVSLARNLSDAHTTNAMKITIEHGLFERFMCCVGSVRYAPVPVPSSLSSKAIPTQTDRDLQLGSGLGHGRWWDPILTKYLGREKPSERHKYLTWCASEDPWTGVDIDNSHQSVDLAWATRGRCSKGGLMLRDGNEILAIYKPRPSAWQRVDADEPDKSDGTGSLGIMVEGVTGEALEHIILTCVAIEEQILQSKGFGGAYHAPWGY